MAENLATGTAATQNTATESEQKKKNKPAKAARPGKTLVIVTYLIAFVCLIAGLVAPLFNVGAENLMDCMMVRYVPLMFNRLFNFTGTPILPDIPGFVPAGDLVPMFDFQALIVILYTLTCLLGLIMIIPVCAGKKEKTYTNCAFAVELIAVILTACYLSYYTYWLIAFGAEGAWTDYNIFIALGGALIMAIIQSIGTKGSIGVSKTIAVILSALAALALLDLAVFIPAMGGFLNNLSATLGCGETAGFISGLDAMPTGLGIDGVSILIGIRDLYPSVFGPDALKIIMYILLMILAILVLVNLFVDVIGLGTGRKFKNRAYCRNAASNTFALVRYVLSFVVAIALVILGLCFGLLPGIYLYLLTIILFIEMINAIARTAVANKRSKSGAVAPTDAQKEAIVIADPALQQPTPAPVYEEPQPAYEQPQPVYVQTTLFTEPQAEAPAPVQEPYPVEEPSVENGEQLAFPFDAQPEQPVQPAQPVQPTTVYVYGGETDEFMDTLTDQEKVEFVETFIKKSRGRVNGVPDYKMGEDNSDFFPSVFVHVNRFRAICSDELLGKIYRQIGRIM